MYLFFSPSKSESNHTGRVVTHSNCGDASTPYWRNDNQRNTCGRRSGRWSRHSSAQACSAVFPVLPLRASKWIIIVFSFFFLIVEVVVLTIPRSFSITWPLFKAAVPSFNCSPRVAVTISFYLCVSGPICWSHWSLVLLNWMTLRYHFSSWLCLYIYCLFTTTKLESKGQMQNKCLNHN